MTCLPILQCWQLCDLRGTAKEMSRFEDTARHPASVDCALLLLIISTEFWLLTPQCAKLLSVWYGFCAISRNSPDREIFSGPGKIESR